MMVTNERMMFLLGQLPASHIQMLQGMAEDMFVMHRAKIAASGRSRLRLVVTPANPTPGQPSAQKGQ